MTVHLMLDLETLGMAPNGAIASIGAVAFDPFSDALYDMVHLVVDLDGQERLGRQFNGSTVVWWLQQSEAARRAICEKEGLLSLGDALMKFKNFVGPQSMPCWAYGSTFDHTILQSAYDALGLKSPVHYRDQLCMRGLVKLTSVECPDHVPGTAHNALDDAVRQARWLQEITRRRMVEKMDRQ